MALQHYLLDVLFLCWPLLKNTLVFKFLYLLYWSYSKCHFLFLCLFSVLLYIHCGKKNAVMFAQSMWSLLISLSCLGVSSLPGKKNSRSTNRIVCGFLLLLLLFFFQRTSWSACLIYSFSAGQCQGWQGHNFFCLYNLNR